MGLGDGHDLKSVRFRGDLILEHCYDGEHRMKWGDEGDAVAKVQQALSDRGYPAAPDGKYGNETQAQVAKFKEDNGIVPSDGVVGEKTMTALDAWFESEPGSEPISDTQTLAETIIQGNVGLCPDVSDLTSWANLINFRPPSTVQESLRRAPAGELPDERLWRPHRIEEAYGLINLDFYTVVVTRLPTLSGATLSAEDLLSHVRLNLNEFFDTSYAEFSPYDEIEGNKWSSSPLTTVGHFDMNGWLNLDDGSVVCSEFAPDHWIFSTIWTPDDQDHPVSGNREFGFFVPENPPGGEPYYVFYARGADRPTGLLDNVIIDTIFAGANSLWMSFQVNLTRFIDDNGGYATLRQPYWCRYDWDAVRASYYNPTTPWVD